MVLESTQLVDNRYRIIKLLGKGGMGAVYQAWDTRLNQAVALKEMCPQPGLDPEVLKALQDQFAAEARVLATLNHINLVRVTDYFEWEGNEYLVMDFVEGENLASRIQRQGPQPEADLLKWAAQLLAGLAYCHQRGVLHRDIKPQNIIITPEGGVKLVDFGLVKLWDPTDPQTRTVMRGAGTPEYAPPEQYDMGLGHTDPRTDIYSVGATLYHAATGKTPPTATQRMANPVSFTPPRQINSGISSGVEAVILRAMSVAMGQRYQSAQEMASALRNVKPAPSPVIAPTQVIPPVAVSRPSTQPPRRSTQPPRPSTRPPQGMYAPPAKKKSARLWIGLAVGAVLCLVLSIGGLFLLGLEGGGSPTAGPSNMTAGRFNTVAFSDSFSNTSGGWRLQDDVYGKVSYQNDALYILHYADAPDFIYSMPGQSFSDARFEVTTQQVAGSLSSWQLFLCRYNDPSNYYAAAFSADGSYAAFVIFNDKLTLLVEPETSASILQGRDVVNRVELECDGSNIRFSINGDMLFDVTDTSLSSGDVALGLIAADDRDAEVAFDNFTVYVAP